MLTEAATKGLSQGEALLPGSVGIGPLSLCSVGDLE